MTNISSYDNSVSQLAAQADAVGRLAQDSGGFAAVMAAFESKDPDAFRWVLDRLELLPRCELICEWVLIKFGVLRCIEVCGPRPSDGELPNLAQFAQAIVRLASDEKQLRRVVDAVSCGNAEDYAAAIAELKLEPFCRLLCHWVYVIIYRRVCEIVCVPEPVQVPVTDPATDIRAAASVMARVVANQQALGAIGKATIAHDCEMLQSALNDAGLAGQCEIICTVICTWRTVWVCRELCERPSPVLAGVYAVEEARNFALAVRQLASQPRALGDLVSAAQSRNANLYSAVVDRFGLAPYCLQLCGWVAAVTCAEVCRCVCQPAAAQPWFLTVGYFDIFTDIDTTSGKTNKGLSAAGLWFGGGPDYAFYGTLQLGGYCPTTSPTFPGAPMQYRFLYATVTATLTGAISASQTSITVTTSSALPATPFNVTLSSTGETMTVTGASGATWTVLRGQAGTTAAAAAAGATLSNAAPITLGLVSNIPLQVGVRQIPWPENNAGLAGLPSSSVAPQQVFVAAAPLSNWPVDPTQPAQNTTWVAPTGHYIVPDADGWVAVDQLVLGGFSNLLAFDTTQVLSLVGGAPIGGAIADPGGAPAGSPVGAAGQKTGTNIQITFEATRVGVATVDYTQAPQGNIRVNNWTEVSNLWFQEFGTNCCTPINDTLSVQFTVDHEEMAAGEWSLAISSCSPSAPGEIAYYASTGLANAITASQLSVTVSTSNGFPSAPFNVSVSSTGETMTVTNVVGNTWTVTRGQAGTTAAAAAKGAMLVATSIPAGGTATPRGAYGTIVENTQTWSLCSYTGGLYTRPGLTTGLNDYLGNPNTLTFCICSH